MSNFDLVSDLHLDFYDSKAERLLEKIEPTSETLVVAGDMCEARNADPKWFRILYRKYNDVLYVPGNHEYYGLSTTVDIEDYLIQKARILKTKPAYL